MAQNIPVPLTQVKLYDFLDELLADGVLVHQTAVRPYSRKQVATMLLEAQDADSLLNIRQKLPELPPLSKIKTDTAQARSTLF